MIVNEPVVSVIMNAYNAEKYIAESIQSILNQTFKNFEFLIYNDGSSDGTQFVIDGFNDSRIKVTSLKENKGVVYCKNMGLKEARGKYIAQMDADDISLPDRLKLQVEYLEKHTDVGLLGAQLKILGSNEVNNKPLHDTDIRWWFFKGCPVPQPTAMIRASVIKKHKLYYDAEFKSAEDIEYWIQLAKVTKMANLPVPTLEYRVHEAQESTAHIQRQNFYRDKSLKSFFEWLVIENKDSDLLYTNNLFSDLLPYGAENLIKLNDFFKSLDSKNAISFFGKIEIEKIRIKFLNRFITNLLDFNPHLLFINQYYLFRALNSSFLNYAVFWVKCLLFWKTRKS
jgi:glycosyltransferase involved in cell wall biosynthesis